MLQSIFDAITEVPYDIAHAFLFMYSYIPNLLPPPPDFGSYLGGLPENTLMLLGFCNVFAAFSMISSAIGVRLTLMIFGR